MIESKSRILLVEDQQDIRFNWSLMLEQAGYQCIACGTISNAQQAIDDPSNPFDIAIVDLNMNDPLIEAGSVDQGLALLSRMRAVTPSVAILALTGLQEDEIGLRAFEHGAIHYLVKPISEEVLLTFIDLLSALLRLRKGEEITEHDIARIRQGVANNFLQFLSRVATVNQRIVSKLVETRGSLAQLETLIDFLRRLPQIETLAILDAAQSIVNGVLGLGFLRVNFFRKADEDLFELVFSSQFPHMRPKVGACYCLSGKDPLISEAIQSRRPILVHKNEVSDLNRPEPFSAADVEWFVKVVLQSNGKQVGLICIEIPNNYPEPSQSQLLSLEVLAPALGDAVSAILRHEEENQRVKWQELISGIQHRITHCEREEDVLKEILERLTHCSSADYSYILLQTDECRVHELQIKYFDKPPPYNLTRYRARSDFGVNGRCFKQKKVVIVEHYQNDPDTQTYLKYIKLMQPESYATISTISSLIALPILRGEDSIGILVLIFTTPRQFDPWISQVLQEIADLVGIILANIQRLKILEDEVQRKTTLENMAMLGAGIFHAVKNELTGAKFSLEIIKRVKTWEMVEKQLPEILERINRGFRIADTFADLARPETSTPDFFKMDLLVAELVDVIQNEMNRAEIKHLSEVDSTLPVYGSRGALKIALFDLFKNAIKHMDRGGILTTRIRQGDGLKSIIFQIEDTGKGMNDKKQNHLFRFNAGDPIPPGGIGLGLYVAYRVIKASRGTIGVTSRLGSGTTFTITLPTGPSTPE